MENTKTVKTQGSLRISRDVIATIASCAASEVEGVAGLSAVSAGIRTLFAKDQVNRSVGVDLSDDVAVIEVNLALREGVRIPGVCQAVQKAVKEAVQNMTGMTVAKVNVRVGDIVFEQAAAE